MAFDSLAEKLQSALKKLTGRGKLNEKDVKAAMREVRLALLEADVNFKVARSFVKKIQDRAVGQEIMESLTPGQQVVKIVNEELTALMGGEHDDINMAKKPPTIVMMVGLQGAGKTTHSAKLAKHYKGMGKNPMLVACDVYRPAAIEQLKVVGRQVDVPVFDMGQTDPVDIAKKGVAMAKSEGYDLVFIDTAGRLHIDDNMMEELVNIKKAVNPDEILLVVDAMTGQDAVVAAGSFDEQLGIDGIVMTKMDSDTRGGAALSCKAVTGKPIKFAGTGEKLDQLELFHPERMASRILGMGDVLSLIEKVSKNIDEKKAMELEHKLRTQQFTFDDFLDQMDQLQNMGGIEEILGMMPGMNSKKLAGVNFDEKEIVRQKAIIQSMTSRERAMPQIINASRRRRIARGSGTRIQDVNRLIKSFDEMKKMMKKMGGGKGRKGMGGLNGMKLPFM